MLFWKIAYRNVKKNWRHSVSALLSISASFVSLVLFDGYISDLKGMYVDSFRHRSMLGDVIIENPDIYSREGLSNQAKFMLSAQQQQLIDEFLVKHSEMVQERLRLVNFQGVISNGQQSTIVLGRGYDVMTGERMRGQNWSWNATYGIPLHKSDFANATLLGQGLARKLACEYKREKYFDTFQGGYEAVERPFDCPTRDLQVSSMTVDGQLNALDLTVVGLLDAGYKDIDDRYMMVPLEIAQMLNNSDAVNMITVMLKDSSRQNEFISSFNREAEKRGWPFKATSWMNHPVGETYNKTMSLMSIFRNFVVIVIMVISILSVINTLVKIIKERNREIGTLRSIGFKSRQVLRMFIYETVLLSMIGIGIGMFVSVLMTSLLNTMQIRYKAGMLSEPVLFKISFSFNDYLQAFCLLIGVSLLACLYATRQALKQKVIDNFSNV